MVRSHLLSIPSFEGSFVDYVCPQTQGRNWEFMLPSANILLAEIRRVENHVENIPTNVRPLTGLKCNMIRTFKGNMCKYKRLYHVYICDLFLIAIIIYNTIDFGRVWLPLLLLFVYLYQIYSWCHFIVMLIICFYLCQNSQAYALGAEGDGPC